MMVEGLPKSKLISPEEKLKITQETIQLIERMKKEEITKLLTEQTFDAEKFIFEHKELRLITEFRKEEKFQKFYPLYLLAFNLYVEGKWEDARK